MNTKLASFPKRSEKFIDQIKSFQLTSQTLAYLRGGLAFFVPLVLYIWTLAPTIYNLDSAEFTTAIATGGIVRATGYPLYLLLGRLWLLLPISGDVGFQLNLLSAVCGAGTVFFVDRTLVKLNVGNWASFGALGLLTAAPFFWSLSLVAEVYTLHTLIMAAVVLATLSWGQNPSPGKLGLVAVLGGLGAAHHAATVLLIPGVVLYILLSSPRDVLNPRSLLAAGAGSMLGLSVYLYLPYLYLQNPVFNYAGTFDAAGQFSPVNLLSLPGIVWLVTGQAFSAQMFAYEGTALWREIIWFVGHLTRAFFIVGLGPGLLGMGMLLKRDRRVGIFLLALFVASAFFYIDYRVVDKETMFLPTYLVWAVWVGVGLQVIFDELKNVQVTRHRDAGSRVMKWVTVSFVLAAFVWTAPQVNLSKDFSTRARGETILAQVAPNALVFGWWDTVPVLEYLQLVEGKRPDIQPVNRFLIDYQDMKTLIDSEIDLRPVYINQPTTEMLRAYDVHPIGSLYRLMPRATRMENVPLGGDK